jgi:hypothetical protein
LVSLFGVDRLRIDQANIEERNEQVQLMGSIYAQADEVLVWLEAETEDSNVAAEFVSVMTSKLSNFDAQALSSMPSVRAQPGFPSRYYSRWKALQHLLCCRWFRRGWLQQEAILASSITVI